MVFFPQKEVRRASWLRTSCERHLRAGHPAHRGVSVLGQRYRDQEAGVRGTTGSPSHRPRVHAIDCPKHNGVAERGVLLTLELAIDSSLEAFNVFGGVLLPLTGPIRAEAYVYACDTLTMTTRVGAKSDELLPYKTFSRENAVPAATPVSEARVPSREMGAKGEEERLCILLC